MSDDTKCLSCNETIVGKSITAANKTWHPEHFICCECKKPIGSATFHLRDDLLYCVDDHTKKFTSKCKGCGKATTKGTITAMGFDWHEEHFVCKKCKKPIGYSSFMEHKGDPYCTPCHAKCVAPRCSGCNKPIEKKAVIALDKKWHAECFKCIKCAKAVADKAFSIKDNKPMCNACATLF